MRNCYFLIVFLYLSAFSKFCKMSITYSVIFRKSLFKSLQSQTLNPDSKHPHQSKMLILQKSTESAPGLLCSPVLTVIEGWPVI